MKLVIFLILFCSIAIVLHSKGTSYPIINLEATAETRVSTEEIAELIHDEFGPDVQVASSILQNYYLISDFNGDGNADIAVIVKPEGGKTKIGKFNVNFIGIDPYSLKNGQEIDPVAIMNEHNDACLGVAIIHGTSSGWNTREPLGKYMFYECFSDVRLISKGQKIGNIDKSTGTTPVLKGDAVKLELESGAETVVYWDGRTYRGYPQTEGD
jgi:hypothetical protein